MVFIGGTFFGDCALEMGYLKQFVSREGIDITGFIDHIRESSTRMRNVVFLLIFFHNMSGGQVVRYAMIVGSVITYRRAYENFSVLGQRLGQLIGERIVDFGNETGPR